MLWQIIFFLQILPQQVEKVVYRYETLYIYSQLYILECVKVWARWDNYDWRNCNDNIISDYFFGDPVYGSYKNVLRRSILFPITLTCNFILHSHMDASILNDISTFHFF